MGRKYTHYAAHARGTKKLHKLMKMRLAMRRKQYPEVRGKVVDYITHSVENLTVYFTV